MESSLHTDNTYKIFSFCKNIYPNVGVVLQAYLKRSIADIERLAKPGFNLRICKGIYKENSTNIYVKK